MGLEISVESQEVLKRLDGMKYSDALRDYLVLAVLKRVKEGLVRFGASVDGVNYDSDTEIVMLPDTAHWTTGILVVSSGLQMLTKKDAWCAVLYPSQVPSDGEGTREAELIKAFAPWIPEMLPARITAKDSGYKWAHRKITIQETDQLLYKSIQNPKVMGALVSWGIVPPGSSLGDAVEAVRDRAFPEGIESREDLAWRVIRQEYGLYGESSAPHWRRAISFAQDLPADLVDEAIKAWADDGYVLTPRKNVESSLLREIAAFEKAIGRGVE